MDFLERYSILIFIVLGAIVFGLSLYLGIIFSKLKGQKELAKELEFKLAQSQKEQDFYYADSILMLCKATLQGQCDYSEACIRIKKLLEYFPEIEANEDFYVFQQMYQEIAGFATHQERLNLPKQEIFRQDQLRFKVEQKYEDKFMKSLKQLKDLFAKHEIIKAHS
ncbi:MAG: DUF2489 domain-containing protein [Bacteriovoracaceae bacterium]|jgi:hypothetical protein|nr:hypothetical protein [Halobacteriovoraceae bacterium]MDP7320083.1 DUF2489 domain-containing protein [Bacteriovoracaceae bacterium]|tara:strand:+ start:822 stop:1319 length:498 start_codon:yes stop_codon:yes gene_type:complete